MQCLARASAAGHLAVRRVIGLDFTEEPRVFQGSPVQHRK